MNVAFRTDATSLIGTGHFMRCMTLAEELQRHGVQIRFVSRDLPQYLCDMLETKGMELASLASDATPYSAGDLAHSHWLNASQIQDAQATEQALSGQAWDWLIVDHYALDVRWESAMRFLSERIMVIDDLADRKHDCDLLLDQNYYTDMQTRYNGKVPEDCQLLLGPRYALLRGEFIVLHDKVKVRTGEVKRILVFFGGVDADNYTMQAIEALSEISATLHVDVVIGNQHPFKELIENACTKYGFDCHVQISYMAKLMADADLAIGAGGTATWERCCLGLPALLISLADNQVAIAKALSIIGACVYIGSGEAVTLLTLKQAIIQLLDNPQKILELSENASLLVDGVGINSVIKKLGL